MSESKKREKRARRTFHVLVLVASIDGEIQQEEQALLTEFAGKMHLSEAEAVEVIRSVGQNRKAPVHLPKDERERHQLFRALVHLVAADMVVTKEERRFLERIAKTFGVSQERLEAKIIKALKKSRREHGVLDLASPDPDEEQHTAQHDLDSLNEFYDRHERLFRRTRSSLFDGVFYGGVSLLIPGLGYLLRDKASTGWRWFAFFVLLAAAPFAYAVASANVDTWLLGKTGGLKVEFQAIIAIYSMQSTEFLDELDPHRGHALRSFALGHFIAVVVLWLWQGYRSFVDARYEQL